MAPVAARKPMPTWFVSRKMDRIFFFCLVILLQEVAVSFSPIHPAYRSNAINFPISTFEIQTIVPRTKIWLASTTDDEFVSASDLEALQKLFSNCCDSEGLMTKNAVKEIPLISELLEDGDLLQDEFDSIWNKAPKFPDVAASAARVDVDSFVQVYRDIDDLFEDEEVDDSEVGAETADKASTTGSSGSKDGDLNDDTEEDMEDELESIFESISDDAGLISKDALLAWEEIQKLISDGLLGTDEFDELWLKTKKGLGSEDKLDVDGFLSFNVALDSLFEFDESEMEDEYGGDDITTEIEEMKAEGKPFVEEGDMSPTELFDALAGDDGFISKDDLMCWVELREMIRDEDLSLDELNSMIATNLDGTTSKLSKAGFVNLYGAIDDLFEDEEEDEADEPTRVKSTLLGMLDVINSKEEELPCGLEATEREQTSVLETIKLLEQEPSNLIRTMGSSLGESDFSGTWELLYSSSSAMKFNKGLSGLGGSFPNGKFGGLKMRLDSTKFLSEMEYIERIAVNPEAASFDVSVTGDWELRPSVSLFTGEPSIVLTVIPERVEYGPTSTRADHWKSLGPLNMLDVAYLDKDLRIMRGSTTLDTVFVFRRI